MRRFREGFGDAEIRVIITARDLTRVVPSQWQEAVQNGSTLGWQEWVERVCRGPGVGDTARVFWREQYLSRLIESWSTIATPGRVHVVTVPSGHADRGLLWQRFSAALENAPTEVEYPTRTNPSLGATSAELMRRVNLQVPDLEFRQYAHGFKNTLAKKVLVERSTLEPRVGLSKEEHDRIREIAVTMVDEVSHAESTVLGDLADLVPGDWSDDGAVDPTDVTDAELVDAAVDGLAVLGARLARRAAQSGRDSAAGPGSAAPRRTVASRSRHADRAESLTATA
jgi:hypothetical protein